MNTRRTLLAILVLIAAFACERKVHGYSSQPVTTQRAVGETTQLTVHFVRDVDEILLFCPHLTGGTYYGCSKQGLGTCDVYLQQPSDFNDVSRLATLGHEVWHCMGARHG